MKNINISKVTQDCIQWIRDWFSQNGDGCNAVVGISGGKDSSVVAALCVAALGKDRVIGVLMPCGIQHDIDMAQKLVSFLGIKSYTVNIKSAVDALSNEVKAQVGELSEQARINLSPRIRMSTLYAVAQCENGRVANTCNKSEDWVGYSTRYGDAAGDFSPLANLLVREVKAIGRELGLPGELTEKVPIDGLCGKTDEENLGFTYETLDNYIDGDVIPPAEIKEKIDRLHKLNLFKTRYMDTFEPQ